MALENFGGIRSISVPVWLRLLIFLIVLAVLAADLAIALVALTNPLHKDWFSVSVQLVGSLLPLLLAILLLAFSSRGPEAIRRKTSHLLLHLVPDTIGMLPDLEPRVRRHREGAVGKVAPWKHAHRNRSPAGRFLLHLQDFVPRASLHARENAGRSPGRRA